MPALPHHHSRHQINYDPTPAHELIDGLEPDQLVSATSRPLQRMQLPLKVHIGLWTLRIFLLIMTGLIVYTFVYQLP